jgi:hypothetical protein
MEKLKVIPLALGLGVTWGIGIMTLGWISAAGWGARVVEALSSVYLGFASTFLGGVIGGLWAFADGFLGGLILAALYNYFAAWRHGEEPSILKHSEQPAH